MKSRSLLSIVTIILCIGCQQPETKKPFDLGKVENGIYVNSFFDFEMAIPENWIIQTQEEMDYIQDLGQEMVAGDNEKLKNAIKAAEETTANLLVVFQYKIDSLVDYNPSLMIVSENVKKALVIRNGETYLKQARKILEKSGFQYDYIDNTFEKQTIGKKVFYLMNASVNVSGYTINQVYYSTVINGYALSIIISYASEEQKQVLLASVNSSVFKG
jgi:hypothetical protein